MSDQVQTPEGNFRIYHATAAQDKPNNSRTLEVNIAELNPTNERSHATQQSVELEVSDGSSAGAPVSGSCGSSILAEWLGESNRAFPPDVREGEQVLVYEYANSHQYFWTSMGREDNQRRLERVRWTANDTLANSAELGDDNVYAFEMDTRGADGSNYQTIRLWTSMSNGEQHKYLFIIDAQKSEVHLTDEQGNMLELKTNEHQWLLRNQDESYIQLDKKDINICCHGNITVSTDAGKMVLSSKGDMSQTTSSKYQLQANSTAMLHAGGDMTVSSSANTTISAGANITLQAGGSITQKFNGSGTCTGNGTMTFSVQQIVIE